MYDVTKVISALKSKRGDHRVFRLAENLCMNLILSLRDFFLVKREGKVYTAFSKLPPVFLFNFHNRTFDQKTFIVELNGSTRVVTLWQGPTEFTETLNRITVVTLAILIKTRGIADADHLLYLQTMLEQILATSQHTWSEKTLKHFPSLLRDFLIPRIDKRGLAIQAWQQVHCYSPKFCFVVISY